MREELENKLYERYPELFALKDNPSSCMIFGIGCGDGWYNIMLSLCSTIQYYTDDKRRENPDFESIKFDQIKEKFGQLRIYTSGYDEAVNQMINLAETLSGLTCENCGNPGKVRYTGWNTCRCDGCQQKYCEARGIEDEKYEDEEDNDE